MNVSLSLIVKLHRSWPTVRRRGVSIICQQTLATRTKEEIYQHKDRATSEDWILEVAGFTHHLRILYLPVTLFQDSAISILRCSAKVSMTTWGRKWALRIPTPTTTVDGPGSTTIRRYKRNRRCKRWTTGKQISLVGDVESSSLGEKPPR
jgi:hypothetical protein